jgi:Bacterial Ig domain/Secretion system C-terminal sorting domain
MYFKHTALRSVFTLLFISLFSSFSLFSQVYSTNFDVNAQGWLFSPPQYGLAWQWYSYTGLNNGGGIRTKETPVTATFFAASPAIQLVAGQQYRVKFKAKCATLNVRTITVAINGQQLRTGSTPLFTTPNISHVYTEYSGVFTANSANSHLIIYGNKIGTSSAYVFLYLDDLIVEAVNQAPNVILTAPTNSTANYYHTENIALKATASDVDGTVSKVAFYDGTILLKEVFTAPYEYIWPNAAVGTHSITAVATDNSNATKASAPLNVTVTNFVTNANVIATWNFNNGIQGWTLPTTQVHAFQWYNYEGVDSTAGLRMKLPDATRFAASSGVNLQAGVTYTASFASKLPQSSSTRTIRVAYNSTPSRTGATDIAAITLPADSYNKPPFVRYNPTFTVPTSGNYHLIFYVEDAGYLYVYLDEIILERTILPNVSISSPIPSASFLEEQIINISANATDLDGNIVKVEFFANGIAIKTLTAAPYSFDWLNVLPNDYVLTAKTTDNRGNVNQSNPVNIRVNLPTGILEEYADFQFTQNFDYWWRFVGDWRWKSTGGYQNTGYLYGFTVQSGNYFATHGLQLMAGVNYKLQCRLDASNTNLPINFNLNTAPNAGGQLITSIVPNVTEDFLQAREINFSVATTGLYYLVISHPWTSGSYQQLKIDNVRIVGDMNKAPVSRIILPAQKVVNMAENAPLKLRVEATDFDGTINKVEYYANGNLLGQSTIAPYEFVWPNIAAGNYKVVCKAYDNENLADSSKTLFVNVLENKFSISSLIGNSNTTDEVRASVIQPDGTIAMATNTGSTAFSSITPTLLGSANATSNGTIVRLSPDGLTVLSITKLTDKITDMSMDAQGNLFVAAGAAGIFKLNTTANQLIWQKTFAKYAHRIDAGTTGKSITMTATETDANDETLTGAAIFVHDVDGTLLTQLPAASQYTTDVAIDEASGTAISLGFKNFNTPGVLGGQILPVYVPVYRGYGFDGISKYVGYDWSADVTSNRWINRSNNNMADDRLVRCAIGKDGKLYLMHEVYGGNHCMRYSPFDIMQTVPIVGGDMYFNFANTGTRVKVFVGKHEPATGAYITGQGFTARINPPLNTDNTVFTRYGNIAADATGRVFITGQSASGLPLTVDHQPGEYTGGAFLLVLSPDLATREQCIRLTNGFGRALAVSSANHYTFGGSTSNPLYTVNPFQGSLNTPTDGWFAVYHTSTGARPETDERDFIALENSTISMAIYPNPSESGEVKVSLQGLEDKNFQLQVVNMSGQIVYATQGIGDADLQLSTWKANTGSYFVRLITSDGIMTKKVIVL